MLTSEDIQKLIEVFAIRDEVATKLDLKDLREDFSNLQTSIDAYAKKADTYFQEMLVLAHKVDRLEKWIHQLAERLDIKLQY